MRLSNNSIQFSPILLKEKIKEIFPIYKESRNEILVNCPFCIFRVSKVDTKKHLYINVYKNKFNCFRCEAKGLATSFFPGISYYFDTKSLIEQYENEEKVIKEPIESLPENIVSIDTLDNSHPALCYLQSRIPNVLDFDFPIYYCENYVRNNVNFNQRIIFPVFDENNYYGFQARSIDDNSKQQLRYVNCLNFDKFSCLYNFDNVKQNKKIIITEGIFDCLVCGKDAVCVFGKTLSDKQKYQIIENSFEEIIVFLDSDAVKNSIFMAKSLLKSYAKVYYVLYKQKDPASCSSQEIDYLLNTVSFGNSYGKVRIY